MSPQRRGEHQLMDQILNEPNTESTNKRFSQESALHSLIESPRIPLQKHPREGVTIFAVYARALGQQSQGPQLEYGALPVNEHN